MWGSWARIAWRILQTQFPHQWTWGLQSHCSDFICGCRHLCKWMQAATAWPCGPGGCCQIPLAALEFCSPWAIHHPNPANPAKEGISYTPISTNMSTLMFVGDKEKGKMEPTQAYQIIMGLLGIDGQVLLVLSFTQVTSSDLFEVISQ